MGGMQEHKVKQPYFIHYSDERVMAMAGLYDSWKDAEGNWLTTFTILTTNSSKKLEWYGQRNLVSDILGTTAQLVLCRCSISGWSVQLDMLLLPQAT